MVEQSSAAASHVLVGRDVLDLHIHQTLLAERSLAVERDIVVKNFAAFGAVMLLQTGFFVEAFRAPLVVFTCGVIIVSISAASRVMSIFYARYSVALFVAAKASKKAALRGRDSLYIQRKEIEAGLPALHAASEDLTLRDFLTDTTALGVINIIPAAVGLVLIVLSLLTPIG